MAPLIPMHYHLIQLAPPYIYIAVAYKQLLAFRSSPHCASRTRTSPEFPSHTPEPYPHRTSPNLDHPGLLYCVNQKRACGPRLGGSGGFARDLGARLISWLSPSPNTCPASRSFPVRW